MCNLQRFVRCDDYVVINNVVWIHIHTVTIIRIMLGNYVYKFMLRLFCGKLRDKNLQPEIG